MTELPPVVIIAGPTASGKSAVALVAAVQLGGEIINADSMQIYRELSILTARPTLEDEAQVPHHLYGTLAATSPCSAGRWLAMAVAKIADIHERKKVPIVCGGTGLYLKVLTEGIADIPDVPHQTTTDAEALYYELGGDGFRQHLAHIDPVSAARLLPTDRQRLVRAYAVAVATGQPLAEWHRRQSSTSPVKARFFKLQLMPDRAELYRKIDTRFDTMLVNGGLDEVKRLRDLHLKPTLPAMKALGVAELIDALDGKLSLELAVEQAKKTTRNLAKRQSTWFRNQGTADLQLTDFGPRCLEQSLQALSDFLL